MSALSLAACLALKEMGYPQEQYNQSIYYRDTMQSKWEFARWYIWKLEPGAFVVCPDPLTALEWLCTLGYCIEIGLPLSGKWFWAWKGSWHTNAGDTDDPSVLILAVYDHWEEEHRECNQTC